MMRGCDLEVRGCGQEEETRRGRREAATFSSDWRRWRRWARSGRARLAPTEKQQERG